MLYKICEHTKHRMLLFLSLCNTHMPISHTGCMSEPLIAPLCTETPGPRAPAGSWNGPFKSPQGSEAQRGAVVGDESQLLYLSKCDGF